MFSVVSVGHFVCQRGPVPAQDPSPAPPLPSLCRVPAPSPSVLEPGPHVPSEICSNLLKLDLTVQHFPPPARHVQLVQLGRPHCTDQQPTLPDTSRLFYYVGNRAVGIRLKYLLVWKMIKILQKNFFDAKHVNRRHKYITTCINALKKYFANFHLLKNTKMLHLTSGQALINQMFILSTE